MAQIHYWHVYKAVHRVDLWYGKINEFLTFEAVKSFHDLYTWCTKNVPIGSKTVYFFEILADRYCDAECILHIVLL